MRKRGGGRRGCTHPPAPWYLLPLDALQDLFVFTFPVPFSPASHPLPSPDQRDQDVSAPSAHPPTTQGAIPAARKSLIQRLGPAGLLGIAWLAFPPLSGFLLLGYANTISTWLKSHGNATGLTIYITAFIFAAGLGILPTYSQAILAGFAFGPVHGFLAALCGFGGASLVGYIIARTVAKNRVVNVINENPKAKAIADSLVNRGRWRTLAIVTLLRVPPNSPFAITNLVMASLRIPLPIYLIGTLIGMSPRTFVAVYLGSQLQQWTGKEKPPLWAIIGGFVASFIVLGIIGAIANNALKRVAARPLAARTSDAASTSAPAAK